MASAKNQAREIHRRLDQAKRALVKMSNSEEHLYQNALEYLKRSKVSTFDQNSLIRGWAIVTWEEPKRIRTAAALKRRGER